ncbi:EamA family transporter RarD [Magnetospirillum moscoviense]|nr:EamA family transporter RarD [Magnetospirillum moscoviense]
MDQTRLGIMAVLLAFVSWGVFGVYFHALGSLPAAEIMAHRAIGTTLFSVLVLVLWRRLADIRAILGNPRHALGLAASALAIGANWGGFIWASANGRALEASLGYFIYPLVSILLARLALGERLSARQSVAVGLAALGVGWLVAHGTGIPWVALVLAFSMAFYGLLRKTINVPALAGLAVETGWMVLPALAYLAWIGGGEAPQADARTIGLLALAGPITAIPLVLFAVGARRLRLSTLGMLFYINPTVQMLMAVLVLGEAFTMAHAVAFPVIWAALALYSWPKR